MDILSLLRNSSGAQAWLAQQAPMTGLAALGLSQREMLDREMSYDGSHPRQQEQAARDYFRSYGPNMLADAFIPGYGAGGDAKAASEAYGEGRYGAAAGNALMAAMDFVPFLGVVPPIARAVEKSGDYVYHATNMERASEIAKTGLKRHNPWDYTDQSAWPDGAIDPRVYAGETPKSVEPFYPEDGERAVLRIAREGFRPERGTGDFYSAADIPPNKIEIMTESGSFVPIGSLVNEPADSLPLFATPPAAAKGIRAFHGSPHDFDRFDMSKIGGGEGVQAEGYGLYFAENPQVAQRYRDRVRDADGRLYEVNIDASPDDFVDWNAPLGGQPPRVREWFDNRGISEGFAGNQSGMELLMAERGALGDRGVAESMRDAGIPGIKYLDAGSRGAGDGSRNYVVFDDRLITILRKYGIGGLIAGGGAYALTDAEYAQAAELLAQDGMNTGAQ